MSQRTTALRASKMRAISAKLGDIGEYAANLYDSGMSFDAIAQRIKDETGRSVSGMTVRRYADDYRRKGADLV